MMDLISMLGLVPHPEGGYYKQIYYSANDCLPGRKIGSSIYYYLSGMDFSAWHRVGVDELWHYHAGAALSLYSIDLAGTLTEHVLGDPLRDPHALPQVVVPAGHWMAAEKKGEETFTLVGCACFPAFQFEDFELAKAEPLIKSYPQHSDIIERLTRR